MDDDSKLAGRAARPHLSGGGAARRHPEGNPRLQILHAIEDYWREHRRPPTIREIGALVGIAAPSHVAHHVAILERQGLLRREPGISRGLTPTRAVGLVVQGTIAAGEPIDLFDSGEPELLEPGELALTAASAAASTGRDIYALRVRGTSMIEEGILDGDYVLIAPGSTVASGAIAVAIENSANGGRGAATLKRVFIQQGGVRLQPANRALKAQFIAAEEWDREWSVQGTVVALYRRYG